MIWWLSAVDLSQLGTTQKQHTDRYIGDDIDYLPLRGWIWDRFSSMPTNKARSAKLHNFTCVRWTYLVGFSELVFSSFLLILRYWNMGILRDMGEKGYFWGDMVHFWLLFWRMWLKMNLIRLPIIVCVCKNPIKDNIYIITNKVFIVIIKIPRQTSSFQNLYKNRTYT